MKHQKTAWVLLTALVLASCSATQQMKPENGIVEGTIYSLSNEPFTKLGLQTSDGRMYILKCTKEIEQVLSRKQGQKVKIYYEKTEPSPDGQMLSAQKTD